MRLLLCLLLACAGCYIPALSDPGGTQRRQRRMRYLDEERRRLEDNWHRQDRLRLERERLELERQRAEGW
jgi:hypothetical protein